MHSAPKLFMLLLGCKPAGRHTEQHDVYFGIGEHIADLIPGIKRFWPEAKGKIHVDGWREVNNVDGYTINPVLKDDRIETPGENNHELFFLNLGGYKKEEFDEFHYRMLSVAVDKGKAVYTARQTAFYKHTGFAGATSHIDDKYGIDVDDVYGIADILPENDKNNYSIIISAGSKVLEDTLHLGYFTMERIARL